MAGGGADVFVSYTQADRAWAEWIAWQLEEARYSTRIQAWDAASGMNFVEFMHEASAGCERTLAVLSPDYLRSRFGMRELYAAFAQDGLLIVRVRDVAVAGMLRAEIHVDLVGLDERDARELLLREFSRDGGRVKPERPPRFPGADAAPRFPGDAAAARADRRDGRRDHGSFITNFRERNRDFDGRGAALEELHAKLHRQTAPGVTRTVAVWGLGGVGKSELAREFGYRYEAEYDVVWWVQAERSAMIPGELAGLAEELRVASARDQAGMLRMLWRELRTRDRWLLVFDNVERYAEIEPYLPPAGRGHVLITSLSHNWGSIPTIELREPTLEEAVQFIERRTGASDRHAVTRLAEALGCLPLALEQAAAYMTTEASSAEEYLALFQESSDELLALGHSTTTERTVATVWSVSLRRIGEHAAAQSLLELCSFLGPEAIPQELISGHPEALPEPLRGTVAKRLAFKECLGVLRRYSMATITSDSVTVHRLVQAVVRLRMAADERQRCAGVAARLIDAAFPREADDPVVWPDCRPLLPHALACVEHLEQLDPAHECMQPLLNRAGAYLWSTFALAPARALLERAVKLEEARADSRGLVVADSLNNLGLVLWDLVEMPASRVAHERALAIRRGQRGDRDATVAASLNNLGAVLWDLGDLDAALDAHRAAQEAFRETLGDDHLAVAVSLCNMAAVLTDRERFAEAFEAYRRAAAILDGAARRAVQTAAQPAAAQAVDESAGEPGTVAIARAVLEPTLRLLADATIAVELQCAPDDATADALAPAAALIDASAVADEPSATIAPATASHRAAATNLDNLGVLLARGGALTAAAAACAAALATRRVCLGEAHPDVGWSLTNVGAIEGACGRWDAALRCLQDGLAIRRASLGDAHPDVATNLSVLGTVLVGADRLPHAQEILRQALEIREARIGTEHGATVQTRSNLAVVASALERRAT